MDRIINVKEAVKKAGLNYSEVAEQLFPDNVHPRLALNRVAKGEAFLYEPQIRKLSELTGLSIAELFSGEGWKSKREKDVIYFTNGDFKAELNTKDWVTKLFDKNSLFHEEIIHSGVVTLSEYLDKINNLITNHLNKK